MCRETIRSYNNLMVLEEGTTCRESCENFVLVGSRYVVPPRWGKPDISPAMAVSPNAHDILVAGREGYPASVVEVLVAGHDGADARPYQERDVAAAVAMAVATEQSEENNNG